jgi:hypothetical protein
VSCFKRLIGQGYIYEKGTTTCYLSHNLQVALFLLWIKAIHKRAKVRSFELALEERDTRICERERSMLKTS